MVTITQDMIDKRQEFIDGEHDIKSMAARIDFIVERQKFLDAIIFGDFDVNTNYQPLNPKIPWRIPIERDLDNDIGIPQFGETPSDEYLQATIEYLDTKTDEELGPSNFPRRMKDELPAGLFVYLYITRGFSRDDVCYFLEKTED